MVDTATADDGNEQRRIPRGVIHGLRSEGASDIFLKVIQTPVSDLDGVNRNSARDEVFKQIGWSDVNGKTPADLVHIGGHFYTALFEDSNPEARADGNNTRILEQLR